MKKYTFLLLIIIIIIGAVLRIWNLSDNPHGFFVDEASAGLNAYTIFTTGRDTHGKSFPVIFEAIGDFRDPVSIYSSVPFIALFGLNEFSVRLTSAVYGIAGIIMIYLLTNKIAGKRAGILAALLLAISPWHIHLSRIALDGFTASLFWLLFGLYSFYKSRESKYYYIGFIVGFILMFFSYRTPKLYIIPILLTLFLIHIKEVIHLFTNKFIWIVHIFVIIVLFLLLQPYIQDKTLFQRWNQVKKVMTVKEMSHAYANHFSADFLFIKGDADFKGQDIKRHSIQGVGELYWFQLPFIVIATLIILFHPKKHKDMIFVIMLLLMYPMGSIFTGLAPQATRSLLGVIPFTILSAIGIELVFSIIHTNILKLVMYISLGSNILISLWLFMIALRTYPLSSSGYWGWQYGFKPAISYFKEREELYDDLIITHRFNTGKELLNFYNVELNCKKCRVMHNPIEIDFKKKQLFAVRQEDLNEAVRLYPEAEFRELNTIRLPDGRGELYIGTFTSFGERSLSSDDHIQ